MQGQKRSCLKEYLDNMNKISENVAEKVKTEGFVCQIVRKFSINNNNNSNRKKVVRNMMRRMEDFNLTKKSKSKEPFRIIEE